MLNCFMYIANCPFNKIKILCEAMIGLEKSFGMMYSNLCLNSRETVPLSLNFNAINLKFSQIVGHKAVYNILNL